MIVLFLSCGVIYLKYYAVRIRAGFPGGRSLRMRPLLVWFMGYLRLEENTQGTTSRVIESVTFACNAMKRSSLRLKIHEDRKAFQILNFHPITVDATWCLQPSESLSSATFLFIAANCSLPSCLTQYFVLKHNARRLVRAHTHTHANICFL